MSRQGLNQGAQNSTRMGSGERMTSASKEAVRDLDGRPGQVGHPLSRCRWRRLAYSLW